MRQCKAQAAGNGAPLARTATPQWRIGVAPFGRDDKPSSALLCSLELATASTAVARLTANGFSTRCIHQYHLDGVLEPYLQLRVRYAHSYSFCVCLHLQAAKQNMQRLPV